MHLVSQAFCQSQLPLIDILARPAAKTSEPQCADRRKFAWTITSVSDVEGARLLLLDVVITTGSSTGGSSFLLPTVRNR